MKILFFKIKNKSQAIVLILTITLSILSLAYLSKGFYNLAIEPSRLGARDLFDRWKEQQYIYLGIYPYHMSPEEINSKLGKVWSGGYLPWAFFTGFFVFPNIPWPLLRFYHVLINLVSLGILVRFAYQIGSPFGKLNACFFVVACLAISSHCTTLNVGQYGILINALLIGVFWLLNNSKNSWAGLLMGIAMAKPSISAPYFLILIVKKRIKAVIIVCFYVIFATLYICILTKLSLLEIGNNFLKQLNYFADKGTSGINILTNLGVNPIEATALLALIGAGLIFLLFYIFRNSSLLTLFAIACVIGRLFTYHRFYDNLMLVFLLLNLLEITFSYPHKINIIMLGLVGLTLWFPGKTTEYPFFVIFQITTWIAALIHIFIHEKLSRRLINTEFKA